ncbi:MAG TPA: ATP-dependent DNA helicase UvrD2 [Candidatus Limnocylindria bacterium]|nr:ATP-dependent DNA helicase UvrD2 [Candidatus Limnocylindria bacterium]
MPDPDALLRDLNDEQRAAATATTGPLVILAGAGTGKTRVISHRVAYAAATGAADPKRMLVVTFTDKAAAEMRQRLRALHVPQVQASTFHAAALRQLAHFWPLAHGRPLPRVLESKIPLVAPLARSLPGGYKFTPAKDLTDEIEWAKNRRIGPDAYLREAAAASRTPPIPPDLMAGLYRRYEQARERAGRIDFEDMLTRAVELYERDAEAIGLVHQRYAWFSVDEYQDTNPLQEALLRLWVGDRRDLCVVGDPDQTIYTFTGASADYLTGFAERWTDARVVRLTTNYRSTPQVLALANRLIAGKELRSVGADGPEPQLVGHRTGEAELAAIVAAVQALLAGGTPATEVAVLVRTNAQLAPIEAAFTRAGVPFTVRGVRFHARPEVRAARAALRSGRRAPGSLTEAAVARWREELGFDPDVEPEAAAGAEARERHAALSTLLAIARELEFASSSASVADLLAELDRRDADERAAAEAGMGVTLSTLHRAKGLEWDAVFLPALEEGTLPIRQSLDDPAALAEERRLLYVGITRARRELVLSWAVTRANANGRATPTRPSRFLAQLRPGGAPAQVRSAPRGAASGPAFEPGERVTHARHGPGTVTTTSRSGIGVRFDNGVVGNVSPPTLAREGDEPLDAAATDLLERLTAWRLERSRADGVPAYVVADNRTLTAIARARPVSEAELLAVPGIGPAKVDRYGQDLLRVVGERP